jgi:hypothetical protein
MDRKEGPRGRSSGTKSIQLCGLNKEIIIINGKVEMA